MWQISFKIISYVKPDRKVHYALSDSKNGNHIDGRTYLESAPRVSPSILSGARALLVSIQEPSEYATK